MRFCKIILMVSIIFLSPVFITGCWNYREIDQLAVVAGVAIDKGTHEKFSITVEIVEISGGKESEVRSKTITMEGKTIFDTVRHMISVSGKRLYWSHAKVAIISREVAEDGVVQVLDWFIRDAETRADIHIIISREKNAKDILTVHGATQKVVAFEMDDSLENEGSLSNAPIIEITRFANNLVKDGVGTIATAVDLKKINGQEAPHIMGTAIFKGDKLLGFIDGEDTKDMLFVKNEVKGGVLVAEDENTAVSLEIFKSKTRIKPVVNNGSIQMDVNIETTTAIDEISNTENVIEDERRKKMEASAERMLRSRVEAVIKKVQAEYGVDVFGFGSKLKENEPEIWKTVSKDWADVFKSLKINVDTRVHIKNSAMLSKPLEVGD